MAWFQIQTPPTIDGDVTDAEWAGVPQGTGFIDPVTSQPAADQTVVSVASDDQAIYVAFRITDSQPENLTVRTFQQGAGIRNEDVVSFSIDPYARGRGMWLSTFRINPAGVTAETIAGGRAAKQEWRGLWKGAAKRTATGWSAEMRIPWKVLDLPAQSQITPMINFSRYQARPDVLSRWADITLRELEEYTGRWVDVRIPKQTRKVIEGLAYASPEFDSHEKDSWTMRSGLDVRAKMDGDRTALLSINPDFKNIESQVSTIGFTRSEEFLGESRPFFNEGADFFRTTGDFSIGRAFYSRRIQQFDQGAKWFGSLSKRIQAGALVSRDSDRIDSVANVRYEIDARSNANVYATQRDENGTASRTIGTSANIEKGFWGTSFDLAMVDNPKAKAQAGSGQLSYGDGKVYSEFRYVAVPQNFRPTLGLPGITDRRGVYSFTEYGSDYRSGPIRALNINVFASLQDTFSGKNSERSISVGNFIRTWANIGFNTGFDLTRFRDEEERNVSLSMQLNVNNPDRTGGIYVSRGERGGVKTRNQGFNIVHKLASKLRGAVQYDRREDSVRIAQWVGSMAFELSRTQTISGRWVRRAGESNFYVAYRNSGSTGMETFVILGDPNAAKWRNRVAVKFVFPF